jgi:GNAT superfamily N-acetyltransferase
MTPSARRANYSDLAEVIRLYAHLNTSDPALDASVAAEIWGEILSNDCVHFIVVEEDNRLVSSCMLLIVPNLTRGGRPFAVIENVVTHPGCRRRGLGTSVLLFALEIAWNANCYKVMLATGREDEATLRFYGEAGFSQGAKTHFEARRPV